MIAFIDDHRGAYGVEPICKVLPIAPSTYHAHVARYHCRGGHLNHGTERCISLGSLRIDRAIGVEVVARLQPLGIEAAFGAIEARCAGHMEKRRHVELALEQARYEASRTARQYDAVDPDNRIVAAELERRWNERLRIVRGLEDELDMLARRPPATLGAAEREKLIDLGRDVERAWTSPGATMTTRKQIVRTLIEEILVWRLCMWRSLEGRRSDR